MITANNTSQESGKEREKEKWNQEINSLLSFQKLEFRGHEFSLGLERNFRE